NAEVEDLPRPGPGLLSYVEGAPLFYVAVYLHHLGACHILEWRVAQHFQDVVIQHPPRLILCALPRVSCPPTRLEGMPLVRNLPEQQLFRLMGNPGHPWVDALGYVGTPRLPTLAGILQG